jgi:hypothetical protein
VISVSKAFAPCCHRRSSSRSFRSARTARRRWPGLGTRSPAS